MDRVLVISDIHGESDKFERLLEKVKYDSREDQLILQGDYIDRRPDSKGVLNKVIQLKNEGAIVLRGNHEKLMLKSLNQEQIAWNHWYDNGGGETIESYDATLKGMELPACESSKRHVSFVENLDYYYETKKYIFVHAGVDPNRPLHDTLPSVLVWIRGDFHRNYNGRKTVVFGHTRTTHLHKEKNNTVYFGENNIIGIDGGAVYGGQLNCLEIHSGEVYFVM